MRPRPDAPRPSPLVGRLPLIPNPDRSGHCRPPKAQYQSVIRVLTLTPGERPDAVSAPGTTRSARHFMDFTLDGTPLAEILGPPRGLSTLTAEKVPVLVLDWPAGPHCSTSTASSTQPPPR